MSNNHVPDLAEINEIVQDAQSGAGVVNQKITTAYHQLSEAVRPKLNAGPNLDWCGFAKWASHTVGFDLDPQSTGLRVSMGAELIMNRIQSLPLPPRLLELIREPIRQVIVKVLREGINVEDGLVVKALRAGNAFIFREMGFIFVHLLERLGEDHTLRAQSDEDVAKEIVGNMISAVETGPGRHVVAPIHRELVEKADRSSLEKAIVFYLRAAREPDHRDQLMLAGNVLFTVYEQEGADRIITIGACAPVRSRLIDIFDNPLGLVDDPTKEELLLAGRGTNDSASGPARTELVREIISMIEECVISVLTEEVLVVEIAGSRVRLGHPEALGNLTPQVMPTQPDVKAVMDARANTAAPNWIDLRYRLGFIANYFAAFQQNPAAQKKPDFTEKPSATSTATNWTMPDLVGSNLQSAQDQIQSLTDFAITVTFSHDATGAHRPQVLDRNWKVCSQNIPPGSTIDRDTRIDFGAVKLNERCP